MQGKSKEKMTKLTKEFKTWYESIYTKVLKSDQGDDNLIVALVKDGKLYIVVTAQKIKEKFMIIENKSFKLMKDARLYYKKVLEGF